MRALVVKPPTPGIQLTTTTPVPPMVPGGVRVRVLEVGVCGTDRDIVHGLYGSPPTGHDELVLGHENFGQVLEVDAGAQGFSVGDYVVATVRRGCGRCHMCQANSSDLCETGMFTERGIKGLDGYMAEQYVDVPEYLVKVPKPLRDVGVLLEPLSVVEKAVRLGRAQMALWENPVRTGSHPSPFKALVAGTGAVGLLAALVLKAEGLDVVAVDRHEGTPATEILAKAGVRHVNVTPGLSALDGEAPFSMILEAAGSAELDLDLLGVLAPHGALVLTGIPPVASAVPVRAGEILRRTVLENQIIAGSVNANRDYFELGLRHLKTFKKLWGDLILKVITERRPFADAASAMDAKGSATIKTVLTWA